MVLAFVALFTGGCPSDTPTGTRVAADASILFIGNSYTYTTDIPGIVQGLGDALGDSLFVETVAGPNMALIDHWNDGAATEAIRKGGWDVVVLQQGPSSVEVNRDTLRLGTALFAGEMGKVGARPALFSAWPSETRRQDFARAIDSYRIAAQDVGGILLPVAGAWLAAWARDPNLQLYSDGLHPSYDGAYLAALVIYGTLRNVSPRTLPAVVELRSGLTLVIDPQTAATLRDAAAETLGYP